MRTTHQFKECQTVLVTNEYGEKMTGTIAVIQPVYLSSKHRLTIRKPNGDYFTAYTEDPQYSAIEFLADAPETETSSTPETRKRKMLPPLPAGVFGYSWDQIESMQGQEKGALTR